MDCEYGWLADEQVNVFRHDDISNERKSIAVAHLAKNLDEDIPDAN